MGQDCRLHAFDNLRAVMMWLGIILHVAVNHLTGSSPLPWRDPQTSAFADLIVVFFHSFRMQVFFILAGYFVVTLIERGGFKAMLKHRMRRLLLPFVIFWPVLLICTTILTLVYVHMMVRGEIGIDTSLRAKNGGGASPFNTMHMWFIYYLIWFCVLTAALAPLWVTIPVSMRDTVDMIFRALSTNWWGPVFLAVPLAVVGSTYRAGVLTSSGSLIPRLPELLHHAVFFMFGLLLHRHQTMLFPFIAKTRWRNTIVGLGAFVVVLWAFKIFVTNPASVPHLELCIAFFYNLTSWLWSFALIGLFLRYLPYQNRLLRYVSESSYWVFLVHMLGTIGFGILFFKLPVGAITKMLLNVTATTAACLLSYHLFVRRTAIGVLLNGKRPSEADYSETLAATRTL